MCSPELGGWGLKSEEMVGEIGLVEAAAERGVLNGMPGQQTAAAEFVEDSFGGKRLAIQKFADDFESFHVMRKSDEKAAQVIAENAVVAVCAHFDTVPLVFLFRRRSRARLPRRLHEVYASALHAATVGML